MKRSWGLAIVLAKGKGMGTQWLASIYEDEMR